MILTRSLINTTFLQYLSINTPTKKVFIVRQSIAVKMCTNFLLNKSLVAFVIFAVISKTNSINRIWDERCNSSASLKLYFCPFLYFFELSVQDEWTGTCANGVLQSPIAIPSVNDRTLTKYMQLQFTDLEIPIQTFEITNGAYHSEFESFQLHLKFTVTCEPIPRLD